MTDYEMICILLFALAGAVLVCAGMLAGIRDMLCNIDYDLCMRNMREYCETKREHFTKENEG